MESQPLDDSSFPLLQIEKLLQVVCTLASPIPILMLVTVVALRYGFRTPTGSLVEMTGLSLLVLNVAAFGSKKRWMFSGPSLLLVTLVGISLIGLSRLASFPMVGWTMSGAGLFMSLWNLGVVGKRLGLLRTTLLLLLGLAMGVYSESMYWRSGGEHLIAFPEAMLGGQVHADVLQQAAIVNMMDTYGVASTGLDGLVPLKYHTGSLWVAQSIRRLCGFQALDFIAFGYGLLLIPLYVAGIFGCAAVIRSLVQRGKENDTPLASWIAGALAVIGLFPFMDDPNHWNFNETILNSDSLLFAFGLSVWLIALAATLYVSLLDRTPMFTWTEKIGFSVGLPVAFALVGFVKISQVYLLLALFLYLCFRVKWLRAWPVMLGVVLSLLVVAVQLRTEVGANMARFAPFHFDRIHPEWVPYFFIFYFYWAWLFLFLWARVRNVQSVADMVQAVRTRVSLPVELVFAMVIAGLIPYLLIDFYSPAWKYFTEFHAVLAAVFVAAFIPRIDFPGLVARMRIGQISLTEAFGLILALTVCGHLLMTTEGSSYRMVKSIGEARAATAGRPAEEWRNQLRNISRSPWAAEARSRDNMLECLETLGREPKELRRTDALYIPKTNRLYWDMRQVGKGAAPFIAPAESGMAMINGLPEFEDIGWAAIAWGYPQYKLLSAPEPPVSRIQEAVSEARRSGFHRLWVLEGLSPSGCDLQLVTLN